MLERPTICKSGAPTQDGSRSSFMRDNTSGTSRTRRSLMFQEPRMLKDKKLLFTASALELTRDGELSILTKPRKSQLRDLTKISDSTSEDHSTLFQDSQ